MPVFVVPVKIVDLPNRVGLAMTCRFPPELSDAMLWRAIAADADAATIAHLTECPSCRERAADLATLERRAVGRLRRSLCPPAHELGEHALGLVRGERGQWLSTHLAECPRCRSEIAQLRGLLAEPLQPVVAAPSPSLIARLLGKLLPGGGFAPVPQGVRGNAGEGLRYGVDQIVVELDPAPAEQPHRLDLLGLVSGANPPLQTVQLWQGETAIASSAIEPDGSFALLDVAPGTYQLQLSNPSMQVQIESVTLELL